MENTKKLKATMKVLKAAVVSVRTALYKAPQKVTHIGDSNGLMMSTMLAPEFPRVATASQ